MYNRIFVLCAAVIFTTGTVLGQNKRLVSTTSTHFHPSTGVMFAFDSTAFTYDSALRVSSKTGWKYDNLSVWVLRSRTTNYEYDASGNLLSSTTQLYDTLTGWRNSKRYSSTYNNDNQVLTNTTESWSGTAWVQDDHQILTYNAAGYLISVVTDYRQVIYTYDMQNKALQVLTLIKENGLWMNDYRQTYDYFPGSPHDHIALNADWANNMWVDRSRTTLTYNVNRVQIGGYYQTYNGEDWDPSRRDTITLDMNENPMQHLSQLWNYDAWTDLYLDEYTYDNESYVLTYATSSWNVGVFQRNWLHQYNYDLFVSTQEPLALDFSIFPNPASYMLQVKGKDLNKALLYDAAGQVVLSQKFSGQELLQLPVAHLPAGIYQLQVYDQTGRVGVKQVVIGH
jgi:hypothetical protein